ncbi:unnamed protein product [Amoebophrya sp. A120]|nr:unnamed protein product [Amoebophrya sp. A120]|eukprot:GSA120T00008528001.1
MGANISRPSADFIGQLKYRDQPQLDKPLTLKENESTGMIQLSKQFYSRIWEIKGICWDRGGPFFHELFDYYKRYPKLQVEFLTQMLMQIQHNPDPSYEFKLHWVLMEFLFHGRNHVLVNEILCSFYEQVIEKMNAKIKQLELDEKKRAEEKERQEKELQARCEEMIDKEDENEDGTTAIKSSQDEEAGTSSSSSGGQHQQTGTSSTSSSSSSSRNEQRGGSSSSTAGSTSTSSINYLHNIRGGKSGVDDPFHPYRIKATAQYTLVNLKDVADYGGGQGCSSGAPKWLVVEYHDAAGNITFHRKIIRYKLYERKAKYVDTVAAEFGFPDPKNSELFVVYTDARKTAYRVEEGDDMLQPREEREYDLDWTDCYFIYKPKSVNLRDNAGAIVDIPEENGQVFFLWKLPDLLHLAANNAAARSSSSRTSSGRVAENEKQTAKGGTASSAKTKTGVLLPSSSGGPGTHTINGDGTGTAHDQQRPSKSGRKSSIQHRHSSAAEIIDDGNSSSACPSPDETHASDKSSGSNSAVSSAASTPVEEEQTKENKLQNSNSREETDDESVVLYQGKNVGKIKSK